METPGQRIKKLRKDLKLTQAAIAKSLRTTSPSVTFWENDRYLPNGENLLMLAKILRTTPSYILKGAEPKRMVKEPGSHYASVATRKVPLISAVQAGDWSEAIDNFHPGDGEEWKETTANVSERAFALRVEGDSMLNPYGYPSIPEGAIVIIDPEAIATNGKIVVAKLTDSNEVTLKRLVIDGPNKYLKPLNPQYRAIEINGNCTIIGVAKKVEIDL